MAKNHIDHDQYDQDEDREPSASDAVRDALKRWKARHQLGESWDEELDTGLHDPDDTMESIQALQRRRSRTR